MYKAQYLLIKKHWFNGKDYWEDVQAEGSKYAFTCSSLTKLIDRVDDHAHDAKFAANAEKWTKHSELTR